MGILFAILSYAIDASVNFLDKFLLGSYDLEPAVITIYSGFIALIIGLIVFLFIGFHPIDAKSILIILLSGVLTELILLPYFKALSLDETSRVVPLFNFGPIFVILLSFVILQEQLLIKQYIGATFIICSGFLLSMKKLDFSIFKLRPAFYYMLLASFFTAAAFVLFKLGIHTSGFWQVLPYEGLGLGIGGVLIFLYPSNTKLILVKTKQMRKKAFFFMTIEEIVYISTQYLKYFAGSLIPVSLVSALVGTQSLFSLIYGIILSLYAPNIAKEVLSRENIGVKVIAIAGMFVGLYYIFL